jgi:circadian clock protein KaiC
MRTEESAASSRPRERSESGTSVPRLSTGVEGLDVILDGGLVANRLYLIEGKPGTGKTTLALQFLLDGARRGEKVLYVTLSETADELRQVANSHGWKLDSEMLFELVPPEARLDPDHEQTLLHPSELELGETTRLIFDLVERIRPTRVVFDSMSEMRLLARNSLFYRRQVLSLKHFFSQRQCTVLLLDDQTSASHDLQLHSIAHAVILLEQPPREYGIERRRLRVGKMRGVKFRGGFHDFAIETGGLHAFPRLIAAERRSELPKTEMPSGLPELDALLGGGLVRGTSTLLIGPAGAGKSSLATQYAISAVEQGGRALILGFDEGLGTFATRCQSLGLPVRRHLDSGAIVFRRVDPAEVTPGELAYRIRQSVERDGVDLVVIDSLNGYLNAMPEERFLIMQMHELLTYLNHRGVLTILILAQHGLIGPMSSPVDLSYLSDTVLMMRYFEADGEFRQSVSVVKKRSGAHERAIREFRIGPRGLHVGPPLAAFHGIFTGTPEQRGEDREMVGADERSG